MSKLRRAAQAGTLESCDIMIMLSPASEGEGVGIVLDSPTKKQYGTRIREVIMGALAQAGVKDAKVHANDRGALDCTIAARMETVIRRAMSEA
jgi:citrate lyase subunit gamma (acyl carrier protein)